MVDHVKVLVDISSWTTPFNNQRRPLKAALKVNAVKTSMIVLLLLLFMSGLYAGFASFASMEPKLIQSYFVPNVRNANTGLPLVAGDDVQVFLQLSRGRVLFKPDGAYFGILKGEPADVPGSGLSKAAQERRLEKREVVVLKAGIGRTSGEGVPLTRRMELREETGGKVNFLLGDRSSWQTNLPTYRKLVYSDAWPATDLEFFAGSSQLGFRLTLKPGADPASIILETGAQQLVVDGDGNMTVKLAGASFTVAQPVAWQEQNGARIPVTVELRPLAHARIGFQLGRYDPKSAVTVAAVFRWWRWYTGTYDNGWDYGSAVAVDSAGNAFLTGTTFSGDFPTTPGAYETHNPNYAAFVTKVNPSGFGFGYSTFLGGSCGGGDDIAVDTAGQAYVMGTAPCADFPTTPGAFDTTHNGSNDVFVTKLNAAGNDLIYSTLLGGDGSDQGRRITLDSDGKITVVGLTDSTNFPVTPAAYDPTPNGDYDAFVVKINETGTALAYSTLLGGSGGDYASGVALAPDGDTWVAGYTSSANFPTTPGAYDTSRSGDSDLFIVKLNPAGDTLVYSTLLGGQSLDEVPAIVTDADGNIYLTGLTYSTDFPTTPGAYDTSANGRDDVFVTKMNPAGDTLVYSTFIGGQSWDIGCDIVVDDAGNAYLTGSTESLNFPTTPGAYDSTLSGVYDLFFSVLEATGTTLLYSTYFGGIEDEKGRGIALDANGNIYVIGEQTFLDDTDVLLLKFGCSGDLDHDWDIDSADLEILAGYLAGQGLPAGTAEAECDLAVTDGQVDAADLCWLLQRVVGNR